MKIKKIYNFIIAGVVLFVAFLMFGCFNNNNTSPKYLVQFESNGGSQVESFETEVGLISQPEEISKKDAWFKGWFTDEEFTAEFDFSQDIVDKNITLYAKWLAYDDVFDFALINDDSEYTISSYKKSNDKSFEVIEVPSSYNDKNVTEIKRNAFNYARYITDVTLPNTMKIIGDLAFDRCEKLESIFLPEGLTTIKQEAFYSCWNLESITIPSTAVNLGLDLFGNCEAMTTIIVDQDNPKYDSRNDCNAIIETASNKLILGCKNTTIPQDVPVIGQRAFYYHQQLTTMIIPEGVTTIEREAFNLCGLITLTLPESLTTVGIAAFSDCYYLEELYIPKGLTDIGSAAFASGRRITNITVDEENPKYDSRNDCNAIIETATNTLLQGCVNTVIPDSITKIGARAFSDLLALRNITIPVGVTSIESSAFSTCQNLTSIVLPEGLTEIGSYAFVNCLRLETVVIPDSVKTIGRDAFDCCNKLQAITIPSNLTTIEENVFYACTEVTSVVIPDNVKEIKNYAFRSCYKLETVTFMGDVPVIGNDVFLDCKVLQTIYVPADKVENYKEVLTDYANIIVALP